MKKAVVTGASGYIGSVLVKMLAEEGYKVIGIDRNFSEKVSKYCTFHQFDYGNIDPNIDDYTVIFHLGASSLLGPSATNPLDYFENNTVKSTSIIRYALQARAKLIFASTAAVYAPYALDKDWGAIDRTEPVYESDEIDPPNNYGKSKLMTEQMLDAVCVAHDWTAVSFRFFNVIGSYGEMGPFKHTPHVLSSLARAKLSGVPFVVNGNDYRTKDGTCIRDYVDVKDVCRAMMHAAKMNLPFSDHYKFNLGTGKGYSVLEIIDSFAKATGDTEPYKIGARRVGDPPYLVADPSLFKEHGFEYKYSDNLDEMVASTWRYLNDNRFER